MYMECVLGANYVFRCARVHFRRELYNVWCERHVSDVNGGVRGFR